MKSRSGFTIIELVVTIAVIAILASIGILAYTKQQVEARDQTRYARSTIVAEALEKYYEVNGEYPSIPALVSELGNSGTDVATKLKINADTLTLPGASASVTNSLSNSSQTTTKLNYTASSADPTENNACQTSVTGGCDSFTLTYKNENDNTDVSIKSRKGDRTKAIAIDTPSAPTMTVAYASNNVTGTVATATCNQGATPQYAIATRTNDGAWSAYSAWSVGKTAVLATTQGNKYGFQAKVMCQLGGSLSSESSPSAEAIYVMPINTPSAPVLTVTPAADNNTATWNWTAVSCPAGTTAEYTTSFYRDDATGWRPYDFNTTQTTTSVVYATNYQGYDHRARAQARCKSPFVSSSWSVDSNNPSFISPIAAVDATNFVWSTYNGTPLFTWTEPSCGLGTQLERRYWTYVAGTQYFANGTSSANKATTAIFNSTRSGVDTFAQWENNAALTPSQLDMTIVNQRGYTVAASQGAGWLVNVGSPNTNSQNDTAVRAVVQLRCNNTTTSRNAAGNYVMSGMFTR